MKKVMCFGTFDLFHLGHLNYFEQAKQFGDYLIVVVARDKTKILQHKETTCSEEERRKLVDALDIVNEAVLGNVDNHFRIVQDRKPDVICLGYDHKITIKQLTEKLSKLGLHPKIVRLQPYKPEHFKSSLLKQAVMRK
jgi:cytidyltransferase-like protein